MAPRFSIILPVRHAEGTIDGTLRSLLPQCVEHSVEVIAACNRDDPAADRLIASQTQQTLRLAFSDERAGIPQLRRDAARLATGQFLVLIEDHCLFADDWLVNLEQATGEHPEAVCGGTVQNLRNSFAGWAQYFTRYSSFLSPASKGTVSTLPGNNACYPASRIRDHDSLLDDGFWEAEFNSQLRSEGVSFYVYPQLAIWQNQQRGMLAFAKLRFLHGRCYGGRRGRSLSSSDKALRVILCPALPLLLFFRIARACLRSSADRLMFLVATPLIWLYVIAWAVGETGGYLIGPGASCGETD